MVEYLICDVLCAIEHLKYVLLLLLGFIVYNSLSKH
jgi:hypothetical protein